MSVAFVASTNFTGTLPATSGAYTPGSAGNQILQLATDQSGSARSISFTGSASTFVVQAVSASNNFTDGSNTYAVWDSLSCASGAQTFVMSATPGDTGLSFVLEFSGAVSLKNATYKVVAAPGTGAGAIGGTTIANVAATDILIAWISDSNVFGAAASVNSPASSSNPQSYGTQEVYYWTGTGGSMTPTFTTANGSDTYIVVQVVVSATSSGGSNTANIAWVT